MARTRKRRPGVKIRRPVLPEQTIVIDATLTRTFGRLTLFEATASVDGQLAASGNLTLARLPD